MKKLLTLLFIIGYQEVTFSQERILPTKFMVGQQVNYGNLNPGNAIPFTLISFSAQSDHNQARLEWKTGLEKNNLNFNIQRTRDFETVENIGTVEGNGNANVNHHYRFTDELPFANTSYYRLEHVDFEGTATYSQWVAFKLGENVDIRLYPNPVVDGFYIEAPVRVSSLHIQDASGNILLAYQGDGYYSGLNELQSGTYLIQAVMENGAIFQKTLLK